MMRCHLFAAWLVLCACTPSHKDLGNVYRGALTSNLKSFDPAQVSDLYSHICQQQVYETLYEYKYLARPYDVRPCLAAALPEISADGLVYRIPLKRGVEFMDDPCFPGGKGREVTAHDFVYSVKRLADVRTKTTGWWIFDGKIAGLDAFREASAALPPERSSGDSAFYARDVEGLGIVDDHTLEIRLTRPCPYFKYILTMAYTSLFPREAVDYYGEDFQNHPVGTGPYRLAEWRRGLRLVFERNPEYRHGFYPEQGSREDSALGLSKDAGKPLPFVNRVELYIFEEDQPMWLNFLRGNLDRSLIPKDNYGQAVLPNKTLRRDFAEKGIELVRDKDLDVTYTLFNMEHPVLGKHEKLRQAMSLARNVEDLIELFYNGRAIRAHSPVPPGLFGYDSTYRNPYARYDLEAARRLLAEAGFPEGRGLPEFEYLTPVSTVSRQMGEHFAQDMAAIGVKIRIATRTWPEFLERLKTKRVELAGAAWAADYPDPENFLQLLYGPNEAPGENAANYKNAEYDSLYRVIAVMQDSPERLEAIRRMQDILAKDCPWILATHRLSEYLIYDWVENHKPSAVLEGGFKYYRIDAEKRRERLVGKGAGG